MVEDYIPGASIKDLYIEDHTTIPHRVILCKRICVIMWINRR